MLTITGIGARDPRNRRSRCPERLLTITGIGAHDRPERALTIGRNTQRALWTIPPEKTKSERAHEVPLSVGALRVLDAIEVERGGKISGWLFPARCGGGYMEDPDYPDDLKAALGYKKGERATVLHDLRRTIANRLESEFDVASNVVDALLGHSPGKLRKTYRPSPPLRAMRAALDLWCNELDRILSSRETEDGSTEAEPPYSSACCA